MKPVVILDANALYSRKPLTRADVKMFLELSRSGVLTLVVPEVVLHELSRQWAEGIDTNVVAIGDSLKHINEALAEIGVTESALIVPRYDRKDFYDFARRLFLAKDAKVPTVPSVSISALLEKDLDVRKPFARDGKGFRDALIWETIRQFCHELDDPNTSVIFVTRNHTDFCTPDTRDLHPHLRQDLHPDQIFEVVTSLHNLEAHALIEPLRNQLDALHEIFNAERLEELVDVALADLHGEDAEQVIGVYEGDGLFSLPIDSALDSPTFDEIIPDNSSIQTEIFRSGDGELTIRVAVDCDVSLAGYIDKSDFFMSDGGGVTLLEDWNNHVFLATASHRVRFTLSAWFAESSPGDVVLAVDEAKEISAT